MSETADIIGVVEAVKAVQRIKLEHRHEPGPTATFFSEHDVWLYVAVIDSKVCEACRENEKWSDIHGGFKGDHLRSHFPYLEIIDVNTIAANVHPNCRCYLTRKLEHETPQV